ncbi:MAG: VWA domain-containing protein [Bacteroidia bacterium]
MKIFRLLSVLVLLCCSVQVFGQKAIDSLCVRETMNHYVAYVNDNIRLLYLYHSQLEAFNRELNLYYEASPSERETMTLRFSSQNLLTATNGFGDFLPNERFNLIKAKYTCIPPPYRDPIHRQAMQLKEIAEEVAGLSERLALYVRARSYREEVDLKTPYSVLTRCHVLFHDFGSLKDGLYYELNKLYRNFENPSSINPYLLTTRSLMRAIVPMRSVLRSMKQDQPDRVQNNLPRLQNAISRAEKEMAGTLAPLDEFSRTKAEESYFYITAVAGDFIAAAKEYMQNSTYDPAYAAYGKSYFYYNNRLLSIFNGYGEGLAERYNRLIDASNTMLLKTVEEAPWLKVIQPEAQRKDSIKEEPTPIETTVPTIVAEAVPISSLEGAPPNNLVFLLDVSRSMEQPDRLPLLKSAMKRLLDLMRPEDRVAVVTYSGEAKIVLPSTSAKERDVIIRAIDNIEIGSKTNALHGLVTAYRVAQRAFAKEGNNRIIMASDGYFRIPEAMPRLVRQKAEEGIVLSLFFFGNAGTEDEAKITDRLDRLSRIGQGNYRHITPENADEMLLEEAYDSQD